MWKKCLIILLMSLFSCDYEEDSLYFIGDSLIYNWDLEVYFPTRIVENRGVVGSGINDWKGVTRYYDKDVVIILGTNDICENMDIDHYTDEYLDMLEKLGARKIFLFSILPREANNLFDINHIITQVNNSIFEKVKKFPQITYLDVYDLFLKDGELNPEYSYDGVHINQYGYEILTKKIVES